MNKGIYVLFVCFLLTHKINGQEKTFVRDYTYKASELDSKLSCRTIAINQLRSLILGEIGIYIESEHILISTEISNKFSQSFKENILTLTAGITKLVILDEKWDGEEYIIKASITVDKKKLEESLNRLISDKQKLKEIELLNRKLADALSEINRLKGVATKNIKAGSASYQKGVSELEFADFLFKGDAKFNEGKYESAIADYTRAIENDPTFSVAYLSRGRSLVALSDIENGIKDFTKAIGINKKEPIGYFELGLAYYYKAERDHGGVGWRKRIRLENQDYRDAVNNFNKAIKLSPGMSAAYIDRGLCWQRLKDKDMALKDYDAAIELSPSDSEGYFRKGCLFVYGSMRVSYSRTENMSELQKGCFYLEKASNLGSKRAKEILKRECTGWISK